MDFEGIVYLVLPLVTGQGVRGEWRKQEVIFELPGEFARKLSVSFWNDRSVEAGSLKPGDRVAVSANVESREHNERWFTEVRGWRMSRIDTQGGGYGGGGGGYGGGAPQGGYAQGGGGYGGGGGGGGYGGGAPQGGYGGGGGGGYGGAAPQGNGGYSAPQQSEGNSSAEDLDDLPF